MVPGASVRRSASSVRRTWALQLKRSIASLERLRADAVAERRVREQPADLGRRRRGIAGRVQQAVALVFDDLADLAEVGGDDRLAESHVLEELCWRAEER